MLLIFDITKDLRKDEQLENTDKKRTELIIITVKECPKVILGISIIVLKTIIMVNIKKGKIKSFLKKERKKLRFNIFIAR